MVPVAGARDPSEGAEDILSIVERILVFPGGYLCHKVSSWGLLVLLFSMQHPLVSAQGLGLALPHKIGGIGAQNLKRIQCFPFW